MRTVPQRGKSVSYCWASQVYLLVKNLPARQKMWVWSLSGKDPLEESMAATPFSCLENFMDRGTWRAAFHRVAKSQTWLNWFSMHTGYCYVYCDAKSLQAFLTLCDPTATMFFLVMCVHALWQVMTNSVTSFHDFQEDRKVRYCQCRILQRLVLLYFNIDEILKREKLRADIRFCSLFWHTSALLKFRKK